MLIRTTVSVKQFQVLILFIPYITSLKNNPYHHEYLLDPSSSYTVQWTVDWSSHQVTFNVTAATRGYIALGLSSSGRMAGADLIICGVDPSGIPYLMDMYGSVRENQAILDPSQDYQLISAWENTTHTSVLFSRIFDTCDENDLEINDNSLYLLWAVGEKDDTTLYHFRRRGSFNAYLLDPDFSPRDILNAVENQRRTPTQEELGDLQTWTVTREQQLPSEETVYWCSFHKGPELERRHHIIGSNFRWGNQEEYDHTHHMLLFRCRVPSGENASDIFEPYIRNNTGEMCYFLLRGEEGGLPTHYCRKVVYNYAIGSRMTFFPDAGTSIGLDHDEYFLLQVHYTNPRRQNLNLTIHIDMYYTPNLQPNEAGAFSVGHQIPGSPSLLVPPSSIEHVIYGHCGGTCTNEMLPPEGIQIMAVQKHTHNSGTKVRLRQFRGGTELPWVVNDDNYNNQYQATRMLRNERRVLRGDQLMVQCTYDNTWKNGTVTGGFSVRDEMCLVYIWYYGKMNYSYCRSEIVDNNYNRRWLGVTNLTWSDEQLEYVAGEGEEAQGQTVTQISDARDWSLWEREELQRDHMHMMQVNTCDREDGIIVDGMIKIAAYPAGINEWRRPDRQCGGSTDDQGTNGMEQNEQIKASNSQNE